MFETCRSGGPSFSLGLSHRAAFFGLLFATEWIPISHLAYMGRGAGWTLQLAAAFGSFFLALAFATPRAPLRQVSSDLARAPIGWGFLALHIVFFLGASGLALFPFSGDPSSPVRLLVKALCCLAAVLAMVLEVCVFVPPGMAWKLLRGSGRTWIYALIFGLIAGRLVSPMALGQGVIWNPEIDLSWKPATDATFSLVAALLHLFLPQVVADRATMTLGSPAFNVTIFPTCAGFEGTLLMLIFSTGWLWLSRDRFRFPHAALLIPAGMAVMWLSNVVRIAALILIGVGGAPDVAMGGFHSQAGWIAFNCVALGFAILSSRIPFFTSGSSAASEHAVQRNSAVAYLMPFCAILAAGMIAQAMSSGFEWLYPLRLVAAAIALWCFRSRYSELDWNAGPLAIVMGGIVFAIWIGLDLFGGPHSDSALASGLAAAPGWGRISWLTVRTAAAVVTVPIAEELAFRGFLIRRLLSPYFESLGSREYSVAAVLISSLVFGLLHGERWLAGTLAGLLYSIAFLRRGRIGDAVVAHATTNSLLAAWVMANGKWYLW